MSDVEKKTYPKITIEQTHSHPCPSCLYRTRHSYYLALPATFSPAARGFTSSSRNSVSLSVYSNYRVGSESERLNPHYLTAFKKKALSLAA